MDKYDFLQRAGLCEKNVDFISKKEGPVYFEQACSRSTTGIPICCIDNKNSLTIPMPRLSFALSHEETKRFKGAWPAGANVSH